MFNLAFLKSSKTFNEVENKISIIVANKDETLSPMISCFGGGLADHLEHYVVVFGFRKFNNNLIPIKRELVIFIASDMGDDTLLLSECIIREDMTTSMPKKYFDFYTDFEVIQTEFGAKLQCTELSGKIKIINIE